MRTWSDKLRQALQDVPEVTDVDSDQQPGGLQQDVIIDRETASRLGITERQIDNTLYDAFGQALVTTIYQDKNQYHVVMEVAPEYWQNPETLNDIYVSTSGGPVSGTEATQALSGTTTLTRSGSATSNNAASVANNAERNLQANALANAGRSNTSTGAAVSSVAETMVPLSAFAHFGTSTTPTAVNHEGTFVATSFSFNLPVGESLGTATDAINRTMNRIGVPTTIHGSFAGTAKNFQQSLSKEPLLLLAALGRRLYRARNPLRELMSIPSRSFRHPCLRRASARCWR